MGYQDRHYYRDSGSGAFSPLMWLLTGSVPLFTAFGIRVRAHASLVICVLIVLLFGFGRDGFVWQDRVQSMSMLFLFVLLHEFGHCFAARWVGGDADEIVMHPLGGLALARPPHRPLPSFITSAGGPAVTAALCLIFGVALWLGVGWVPWNPFVFTPFSGGHSASWFNVWRWVFWSYQTNYTLLMFNLLPIYPLDGGRMLQEALWPRFGYFKSMNFACITGMIGSVFGGAIALATLNIGLAILALCGFLVCFQSRRALLAAGPEEYADSTDYSAAYETFSPKPKRRPSRWAARRAMKNARAERQERQRIDQILAKVSAHGMQSLTWSERRALKKATEHQRQRDLETSGRSPRA